MQSKADIEFDQLVKVVKKLSARQWTKLKTEIETASVPTSQRKKLEKFLLSGPTFSKKQLEKVVATRKALAQWRTK